MLLTLIKSIVVIFLPILLLMVSTSSVDALYDLPHKGDWITNPGCPFYADYPGMSATQRTTCRVSIKNKGYTHQYVIVTTGSDSAAGVYNFYNDPTTFRSRLLELVNDGIKPVVFLTSDSATWRNKSTADQKSDIAKLVPVIDDLVSSYSLAIEINEYWSNSEANEIGSYLNTLSSKPISVHQTPGKWDYCQGRSWCDYMILQTNNPNNTVTTGFIKTKVTDAINGLGKLVVAGEYNNFNESLAIQLGNAALEVCSAGFGNGGTPSKVIWGTSACPTSPTSSPATPTPTSSVNVKPNAISQTVSTGLGQSVAIQLTFEDPDGPGPHTFWITQQPSNGKLSGSDNDRIYTPNAGFIGTDFFKWKVKDGLIDSNIAIVTINIGGTKPGDANGDNKVDGLDYVVWLNHYNQSAMGATNGDFNNSGKVDGLDYVIWLTNYGK